MHMEHNPELFWAAIVAVVFIASLFSYLERSSRYRAIERLAEKGQTVPPEMFRRSDRHDLRYRHPVLSGIYLMCVGVALTIFLWAMQGGGSPFLDGHMSNWLPAVGIFPFMIGLARLLGAAFDRPRSDSGS